MSRLQTRICVVIVDKVWMSCHVRLKKTPSVYSNQLPHQSVTVKEKIGAIHLLHRDVLAGCDPEGETLLPHRSTSQPTYSGGNTVCHVKGGKVVETAGTNKRK